MPTIAQNIETIKDGIDDIKENLGLSQNASLANVVTKSESVIEPTGTISITENGTVDVTNYANADVNVESGGADLSEYFYLSVFGDSASNNYAIWAIKKLPDNLTINPNTTNLAYAFNQMKNLVTAPQLDTSNIKYFRYMFNNCSNLENVPFYDASSAQENIASLEYMFSSLKLTDQSLDNILQMCISAPANVSGRNLARLGISNSTAYPVSRIQALPHYQEFINANWKIGY